MRHIAMVLALFAIPSISNAGLIRDLMDARDTLNSKATAVAVDTAALRLVVDTTTFKAFHASGFNSTLGQGTTFMAFVPDWPITLRRVTVAVVVAGVGGSGDRWYVGSNSAQISVVSPAAAAAGSVYSSATLTADVLAGTTVYMWLQSGAATTPTGNVVVEYHKQ